VIDGAIRGYPTHFAIAIVIVGACPAVVVTMTHDVRATAEPHHRKEQSRQEQKIQDIP